jgi:hypothetical protein
MRLSSSSSDPAHPEKYFSQGDNMWLPSYVLFLAVGIVVAIFAIKLVVSLRVAHHAAAWETLGDNRPGAANVDLVIGETRAERVLVEAGAGAGAGAGPVPIAKRVRRSRSKQPGKRKKVA